MPKKSGTKRPKIVPKFDVRLRMPQYAELLADHSKPVRRDYRDGFTIIDPTAARILQYSGGPVAKVESLALWQADENTKAFGVHYNVDKEPLLRARHRSGHALEVSYMYVDKLSEYVDYMTRLLTKSDMVQPRDISFVPFCSNLVGHLETSIGKEKP